MIRLIEVLNFRCLKYINQRLQNFQVLVGRMPAARRHFWMSWLSLETL